MDQRQPSDRERRIRELNDQLRRQVDTEEHIRRHNAVLGEPVPEADRENLRDAGNAARSTETEIQRLSAMSDEQFENEHRGEADPASA